MPLTRPFLRAVQDTMEDHERFGGVDSGDWEENGAMRVVGVGRAETLWLCQSLLEAFDQDLQGDTGDRASALLATIEIAMATGVRLERARWEPVTA